MAKEKYIPKETEEKIISVFLKGNNLSKIAEDLNMNRRQIRKVLVKHGLYKVVTKSCKAQQINEKREIICGLYNEGKNIKEIKETLENEYDLSVGLKTISNFLKSEGFKLRTAKEYNRKYDSNNDAFKDITPLSCYWGGIMASDGCIFSHGIVSEEENYFCLGVSEKDKELPEKLKEFVGYNGNLYIGKRNKVNHNDCVELRVNNINIVNDLRDNFNITNAKSCTYIPPELDDDLKRYFILGLLDGDGSIGYTTTNTGRKHFSLQFTGTKESCEYILDYFGSSVKIRKRYKNSEVNNYSFVIQGNIQIYKILKKLYSDDIINTCLQRKYLKFKELEEQIIKTYGMSI